MYFSPERLLLFYQCRPIKAFIVAKIPVYLLPVTFVDPYTCKWTSNDASKMGIASNLLARAFFPRIQNVIVKKCHGSDQESDI